MQEETKRMFGIPKDRFYVVVVLLMIMWIGLMLFFYLKADEVTHDPCGVCANKMGKDVTCTTTGMLVLRRTYHPNYSIEQEEG